MTLRSQRTIILLVALLSSVMAAWAQEGTYRLQPEDVIRIQIYNENQINALIPIGRDGNISAPFVGIVKAEGKTTSELEEELKGLYVSKLKIRDPIVSVTIEAFRRIRASVGGFVSRPDIYDMRVGDTIKTLLDKGGGVPTDGRADLRRATLRRRGMRELIPIDLYAMIVKGDTSQNYVVEDGDELTIPEEVRNRITIIGRVRTPGVVPYRESMRLVDAVQQAGGEIERVSRMSKVIVIREYRGQPGNYMRIQADLVKFWAKGDSSQNILLEPGDYVYVGDAGNLDINTINTFLNGLFIFDRFGLNPFRFLGLGG